MFECIMRLNRTMATRNTQSNYVPISECTEFSIHAQQKGVLDFTESKLNQLFRQETDTAMRIQLAAMFEDYVSGNIAVAFSKGKPVCIRVTKNG